MLIEISGGGFGNKGAELMLLTVLNTLRSASPSVEFCMSPSMHDPKYARSTYGILEQFPFPAARGGRLFPVRFIANRISGALVPKAVCDAVGLVRYQDTDALLDISGVRFGDAVGTTAARNLNRLAAYYRKRGKPVILLPQMLGPFTNSRAASEFERIASLANLVFARDRRSYGYAQAAAQSAASLRIAPDITVFTKARSSSSIEGLYGCIVPNARMFDRGKASWAAVYLDRLVLAAELMLQKGVRPIVVVHSVEGDEDRPLADKIVARIGRDQSSVVVADDPAEVKGVLAGAHLVVASRYHSVVSALSSGVPAVVLGWAHKYETLLDDFHVPQLNHTSEQATEDLLELVALLCDPGENERLRRTLRDARDTMVAPHETMWNEVFTTLGLSRGDARTSATARIS